MAGIYSDCSPQEIMQYIEILCQVDETYLKPFTTSYILEILETNNATCHLCDTVSLYRVSVLYHIS